jgi:PadR family transcriptional regulator PadR
MLRRPCPHHKKDYPCSCAMGNLYRFVEPLLLFLLKEGGQSYGYELAAELPRHAMTDSTIELAALYRTLRQLEENGCVTSQWDAASSGPARRVYALTARGDEHLEEWIVVLGHLAQSMTRFVGKARKAANRAIAKDARPAPKSRRQIVARPPTRKRDAKRTSKRVASD